PITSAAFSALARISKGSGLRLTIPQPLNIGPLKGTSAEVVVATLKNNESNVEVVVVGKRPPILFRQVFPRPIHPNPQATVAGAHQTHDSRLGWVDRPVFNDLPTPIIKQGAVRSERRIGANHEAMIAHPN